MDFTLPEHLPALLARWTPSSRPRSKPLEREHMQYFDRRREFARTDIDNGGIPRKSGRTCSTRCVAAPMRPAGCATGCRRSSAPRRHQPGHGRHPGTPGPQGPRLHNDLQDESSIVGNFPQVIMMDRFGTENRRPSGSRPCSPASGRWRSGSPNRTTARTPPGWRRPPNATATTG